MLLLRAVVRIRIGRRRRTITTSRWHALPLLSLSLQRLMGAVGHTATSDCASPPTAMTVGRGARCTTPGATTMSSVERPLRRCTKRAITVVYGHSDSESGDNECYKQLHIIYDGSWGIMSRHAVKTLRRAVVAIVPRVAPHHKWMVMLIAFDVSDYPKNRSGVGQLPLVVSPTIANIRLYHVLVDGGATLNLISLAAFQKLQISMSRLSPSRPFLGVGPGSIILRGSISLSVTFRMPKNYRTESILFDVTEVNLPFNAIIGRPTLYQFVVIAHYGYLILKMSLPNSIIKIRGDRIASVFALEKLQARR
jgi:hypothetical protein